MLLIHITTSPQTCHLNWKGEVLQSNTTVLKIPAGRRQTSWLFTNKTESKYRVYWEKTPTKRSERDSVFQVRRLNYGHVLCRLPLKLSCNSQSWTGFCERYFLLNLPLLCNKPSLLLLQRDFSALAREQKSQRGRGWWDIRIMIIFAFAPICARPEFGKRLLRRLQSAFPCEQTSFVANSNSKLLPVRILLHVALHLPRPVVSSVH